MQINITARHLVLTDAIADYVNKKVEKCQRYFDHLVWAQVILSVEKYRQVAEIIIHAAKTTFRAQEESIDLYAAIDLAVDKIEKQLRKYKEKFKIHRKSKTGSLPAKGRSSRNLEYSESKESKHLITEIKRFNVKPVSVDEAIREMNLMEYNFFMFLNPNTSQINVVYRKENGSYGLIEPEL